MQGGSCKFRHVAAAINKPICKVWMRDGQCSTDNCPFRHPSRTFHDPKRRDTTQCYWETQPSGCAKPHCPFMHMNKRSALLPTPGSVQAHAQVAAVMPGRISLKARQQAAMAASALVPSATTRPSPSHSPSIHTAVAAAHAAASAVAVSPPKMSPSQAARAELKRRKALADAAAAGGIGAEAAGDPNSAAKLTPSQAARAELARRKGAAATHAAKRGSTDGPLNEPKRVRTQSQAERFKEQQRPFTLKERVGGGAAPATGGGIKARLAASGSDGAAGPKVDGATLIENVKRTKLLARLKNGSGKKKGAGKATTAAKPSILDRMSTKKSAAAASDAAASMRAAAAKALKAKKDSETKKVNSSTVHTTNSRSPNCTGIHAIPFCAAPLHLLSTRATVAVAA